MNINRYLSRIGVSDTGDISLALLIRLQQRHATEIPFENMDILLGVPISLDPLVLFKKIVESQRGGVCYELNGLFHFLLQELGFSVSMAAATVKTESGWFIEGTHAMNIVRVDEADYLVDVGFGGKTPRRPIPLTGEEIQDSDGFYRIRPLQEDPGRLVLQMKETSDWNNLYKFYPSRRELEDFKEVCVITQTSTESKFNKALVAMIPTPHGRVNLQGQSLTFVDGENKTKQDVEPERIERIMSEIFKIAYPIGKSQP